MQLFHYIAKENAMIFKYLYEGLFLFVIFYTKGKNGRGG